MLSSVQLEERLDYICGTDAASIVGKNPFKSKVQLWLEKTRRQEVPSISDKGAVKFGYYVEDGIVRWFEDETGLKTKPKSDKMIFHPTIPFLAGSPDRIIDGENAILECKSAYAPGDSWGDGVNKIPANYLLQVAHYCAVGNYDKAYIAVFFKFTSEMRIYTYIRDKVLEEKLIAREVDFWTNHVQKDICPEPQTTEDVLEIYQETNGKDIVASCEVEESVTRFLDLNKQLKEVEAKLEQEKNAIATYMKNCEVLVSAAGQPLATWKYTKPVSRFDAKTFEKESPDIYDKYIKESPGYRRFLVSQSKGN